MLVDARSSPSEPVGVPTSLPEHGEIFTPNEVAQYLKVSKKTVYKMLRSGELPGFKVGKHWRVSRAELGALIASQSLQGREQTG